MSDQLTSQHNRTKLSVLIHLLAGLVASLGLVVLVGWHIKSSALVQIHPSFVPMQYNTALGFLLSGMGLLATLSDKRTIAVVCGALAALTGGLTLIQYGAQLELGIDQLFMDHFVTTKTVFPGRMAPNTALCFFLSGSTILLFNLLKNFSKILLLGPVIIGLGLMAFLGYLFGVETRYGWEHLTRMALHTSAGFILVGSAFSLLGLTKINRGTDQTLRNWPIISISILLLVLVLTLWQAVSNWQKQQLNKDLLQQVENIATVTENYINSKLGALERMGLRWEKRAGIPKEEWQADADMYIKQLPVFQAIEWVDSAFNVRWIAPLKGNEKALNLNLAFEEARLNALLAARDRNIITISQSVPLVQGELGFLVYIPLQVNNQFDGFILGVVRVDKLFFELNRLMRFNDKIQYKVFEQDHLIYASTSTSPVVKDFRASTTLSARNLNWRLEISPTEAYLTYNKSYLPGLILVSGLAGILLLIYFYYLRRRDILKTRQLASEAQKRLSAELEKQQLGKLNEALFNASPIAMLVVNAEGDITTINQQSLDLFGYQADELLNQSVDMLLPSHLRSQHVHHRSSYMSAPSARKIISNRDIQGQRRDGRLVTLDITLTPLGDEHKGQVLASIIDISEITENRRRLDEHTAKLEKANRELERSNQELDDFAYVASHDLKAPLRGIMQLANWIEEDLQGKMEEETGLHLKLMQSRVARLENLLDDLLAYSRVGKIHGDFKLVNVTTMVNELFELLVPPAGFTLSCADDLPDIMTLAVPLEQIFRNLINNAIKHHDKEQGHIHVSAQPADLGYVFIVEDDGPGIAPDQQQRAFGIFQTLKPRDDVEGSGIGLAIIKKLLDYYQCSISIESDGQRGTRMIFTWPDENTLRGLLND